MRDTASQRFYGYAALYFALGFPAGMYLVCSRRSCYDFRCGAWNGGLPQLSEWAAPLKADLLDYALFGIGVRLAGCIRNAAAHDMVKSAVRELAAG